MNENLLMSNKTSRTFTLSINMSPGSYAFLYLVVQEILRLLERHKQTLQLIHRDRCVNNVPIPMEQLQDMAER